MTIRGAGKAIAVGVGATVLAVATWVAWMKLAPRHVPSGQAPLSVLGPESLAAFRDTFNVSGGQVRVLAMLSPT